MPARQPPPSQAASQEGYSSPPSIDNHSDPFNNSHAARRYYDNEFDNDRRDTYATYASDSSNPALNDQNFYDHNGTYDPYRTSFSSLLSPCLVSLACLVVTAPQDKDTDSDVDVYGQRYPPSAESLGPPQGGRMANSDSTFVDFSGPAGAREAYPAWGSERQIPLSKEEIEDVFLDLTQKFGFQRDSMRNMVSNSYFPGHADAILFYGYFYPLFVGWRFPRAQWMDRPVLPVHLRFVLPAVMLYSLSTSNFIFHNPDVIPTPSLISSCKCLTAAPRACHRARPCSPCMRTTLVVTMPTTASGTLQHSLISTTPLAKYRTPV
jgi:hypothetical protein